MTLLFLFLLTSDLVSAQWGAGATACPIVTYPGKRCAGAPTSTSTQTAAVCKLLCQISKDGCQGYNVQAGCTSARCPCRMYATCNIVDDSSEILYKKECPSQETTMVGTPLVQVADLAATKAEIDKLGRVSERLDGVVRDLDDFNTNLYYYTANKASNEDKKRLGEIYLKSGQLMEDISKASESTIFSTDNPKQSPTARMKGLVKLLASFQEASTDGTPTAKSLLEKFDQADTDLNTAYAKLTEIHFKDDKFGKRVSTYATNVIGFLADTMSNILKELYAVLKKRSKAEEMLKRLMEAMAAFQAAN